MWGDFTHRIGSCNLVGMVEDEWLDAAGPASPAALRKEEQDAE